MRFFNLFSMTDLDFF